MKGLAKLAPGVGNIALTDRPERDPAAGELLLQVLAAGVCGTDLHIEADEYPTSPPVTMGHEVAGLVTAAGDDADATWIGQRVVCETYYSTCRTCAWCRGGRPNLCSERVSIGSRADGAFAPKLVIPVINVHQVPEWIGDHAASLSEPLACVCNCLFDPPAVGLGDQVLVVGPGPIGLLAAQVARAMGGSVTVAGLPTDEVRLAAARQLGFAGIDDPGAVARVDVAIECSGTGGGATTCMESVRPDGRYVQVGVFGKSVTVPMDQMLLKEASFLTGFASTPRSWSRAMALLDTKSVELDPLVTRVARLDEWSDVFDELRRAKGIKTVFDPRL